MRLVSAGANRTAAAAPRPHRALCETVSREYCIANVPCPAPAALFSAQAGAFRLRKTWKEVQVNIDLLIDSWTKSGEADSLRRIFGFGDDSKRNYTRVYS